MKVGELWSCVLFPHPGLIGRASGEHLEGCRESSALGVGPLCLWPEEAKDKVSCGRSEESEVWDHTAFPPNVANQCVLPRNQRWPRGPVVILHGLFQNSLQEGNGTPKEDSEEDHREPGA